MASFAEFDTLEANMVVVRRDSLVSSLAMKAWISCALECGCVAPLGTAVDGGLLNWIGSTCGKSCDCHRFDQSALTIITSFFYGFPRDHQASPACAVNTYYAFYELRK